MSPFQAYRTGLLRYQVKDHGRLAQTRFRLSLLDDGRTIETGEWHHIYRRRRMMAAIYAAQLLGCLERLNTDMSQSPIDGTWIERLEAACAPAGR